MTRVRRGRAFVAASALVVTLVAVLGGVGILPTDSPAAAATGDNSASDTSTGRESASLSSVTLPGATGSPAPFGTSEQAAEAALPDATGEGKRIVFDISDQRVWLVDDGDDVRSTYLVSGSLTDNLKAGSYEVYSRSRWAVGVDDSGVMEYFVRFAHGAHAAIGFHSIPTKDGRALQTRSQLGTPQSHGCIRQAKPDALRLWTFAPVGTKVVVTA